MSEPRRRVEPAWRRLQPGEDGAVDAFLQAHLAMVQARLHDARDWHARPRDYRLEPDPTRLPTSELYDLEGIAIIPVSRVRKYHGALRPVALIVTAMVYAWLLWQVADLLG